MKKKQNSIQCLNKQIIVTQKNMRLIKTSWMWGYKFSLPKAINVIIKSVIKVKKFCGIIIKPIRVMWEQQKNILVTRFDDVLWLGRTILFHLIICKGKFK